MSRKRSSKGSSFAPSIRFNAAHGSDSDDENTDDISVQGLRPLQRELKTMTDGAGQAHHEQEKEAPKPSVPPPRPSEAPRRFADSAPSKPDSASPRPSAPPRPPAPSRPSAAPKQPPPRPSPPLFRSTKSSAQPTTSTPPINISNVAGRTQPASLSPSPKFPSLDSSSVGSGRVRTSSPMGSPQTVRASNSATPDSLGEGNLLDLDGERSLVNSGDEDWFLMDFEKNDATSEGESAPGSPTTRRSRSRAESPTPGRVRTNDLASAALSAARSNAVRARSLQSAPSRYVRQPALSLGEINASGSLQFGEDFLSNAVPLAGGGLFRSHLLASVFCCVFWGLNQSELMYGAVVGAYATFLVGCFVLFNVFVIVEKEPEPDLDFEEVHAAAERRRGQLPGDAVTLMQPSVMLEVRLFYLSLSCHFTKF